MSKRFYLTTAIDYVNGEPHLGHAYEKVITDIIARTHRSLGQEVFYLTGLDEHGQKVQSAAKAEGKDPQVYCDEFAAIWEAWAEAYTHPVAENTALGLDEVRAYWADMIAAIRDPGAYALRQVPIWTATRAGPRTGPTTS